MTDSTETPTKPTTEPNKIWLRGLMMIILAIFFGFAQSLLALLAVVQFCWAAFGSGPNPAIRHFGASLADWLRQTARFQAFATEDKPFPWAEWPKGE
jgi:Domain of unknown function (DUF4389)